MIENSVISRLAFAALQGSLFLCVVWGISVALRRLPAKWKCWLWRLVSIKLLLALLVVVSVPIAAPQVKQTARTVSSMSYAVLNSIAKVEGTGASIAPKVERVHRSVSRTWQISWTSAALLLWAFGFLLVVARDLWGWVRMRRLLHSSAGARVTELPSSARSVLARSGYWAPVRVKSMEKLSAPALVGLFQPTILLPADFESSSAEALSSALAHELAHLRRRDLPWVLLSATMRAVFWFNPLVWVAHREQRLEAEIASDQLARTWTDSSPKDYGKHLLEWVAPERTDHPLVAAVPGVLLSTHELARRMKAMQLNRYNHRSTLAMGAVLFLPLVLGLAPIELISAGNGLAGTAWPKFRGGLTNAGLSAGSGAIGKKKWSFKGGGFDSSPAIGSDGTIYVGSWDQNVYAIDEASGIKKWAFKTDSSVQSSPAVGADGTVYFGSWDGWIYAVNGKTGIQKWTFQTGAGVYASPTIGADGTVYIGSEDCVFYALDGATGAKKWSFKTGEIICSCAAIGADGTVYFGSNDECVYALDGATGAKKWAFKTGGQVVSSPAIGADGTVYVGSWNGSVFAINGTTGVAKWSLKTGGPVKSSPAIGADGTVFVGSFDHSFYAIDGVTGLKKWAFKSGDGFNSSAAISADDTVYVGAWDHNLYALDGKTGLKKWSFKTGDSIGGSPVIGSDGTIYFGSGDHYVYALK